MQLLGLDLLQLTERMVHNVEQGPIIGCCTWQGGYAFVIQKQGELKRAVMTQPGLCIGTMQNSHGHPLVRQPGRQLLHHWLGQGDGPVQSPIAHLARLLGSSGAQPAIVHAEFGHHPTGGEVARHMTGDQRRQLQDVERK